MCCGRPVQTDGLIELGFEAVTFQLIGSAFIFCKGHSDVNFWQVQLQGNKIVPVKPKMYLTAMVTVPPESWVQLQ